MKGKAKKIAGGFESQASRLRRLARRRDVLFLYSEHADVELAKDGLCKIDIENMLRRCRVTLVEESDGEEAWRAEGTDRDRRRIAACVVPYEGKIWIKVITGWAWRQRGRPKS